MVTNSVHHDEHILPNRNLHPDQFAGHGPIGSNATNRTGGIGGTEMSADAHDIAHSLKWAEEVIAAEEI